MSGHEQDELRQLWSGQPENRRKEDQAFADYVERKLRRFDRRIAVRNALECLGAGMVAVFFSWAAAHADTVLVRSGLLVTAAAGAWIVFYLLRHETKASAVDPSQDTAAYTRALAGRYDHQIRLLQSVKYWYLLPMYAGLLITGAGLAREHANAGTLGWNDLAAPTIYTAIFAGIWWLNEVVAVRHLRQQKEDLLRGNNDATCEDTRP